MRKDCRAPQSCGANIPSDTSSSSSGVCPTRSDTAVLPLCRVAVPKQLPVVVVATCGCCGFVPGAHLRAWSRGRWHHAVLTAVKWVGGDAGGTVVALEAVRSGKSKSTSEGVARMWTASDWLRRREAVCVEIVKHCGDRFYASDTVTLATRVATARRSFPTDERLALFCVLGLCDVAGPSTAAEATALGVSGVVLTTVLPLVASFVTVGVGAVAVAGYHLLRHSRDSELSPSDCAVCVSIARCDCGAVQREGAKHDAGSIGFEDSSVLAGLDRTGGLSKLRADIGRRIRLPAQHEIESLEVYVPPRSAVLTFAPPTAPGTDTGCDCSYSGKGVWRRLLTDAGVARLGGGSISVRARIRKRDASREVQPAAGPWALHARRLRDCSNFCGFGGDDKSEAASSSPQRTTDAHRFPLSRATLCSLASMESMFGSEWTDAQELPSPKWSPRRPTQIHL